MARRSGPAKSAPFWVVALLIGGFFAATGTAIALVVVSENRVQVTMKRPGPACVDAVLEGLDSIRRDRELGFDVQPEDATALIDRGDVVLAYRASGIRHEASFRVEGDGADGCRLTLYQEEARAEGAPANRRRGRLATSSLPGCECE